MLNRLLWVYQNMVLHGASLLYSLGGVVFELHSRVSGVQLSYCTMKEKPHTFPVG